MWAAISGLIPIIVAIMKFFGAGIDRRNQIETNMNEWFKNKISAGGEVAQAQAEQEKQAEELAQWRKEHIDNAKT